MWNVSESSVTFALGTLGSVLGVMNTWRAISKDRVRLKVVPKSVIPVGGADPEINIGVEVLNLSSFSLSIEEVGFVLKRTSKRLAIINPITAKNTQPPFKLEPRSSITIYGKLHPEKMKGIVSAYARTSCGHDKRGNSPALRSLVKGSNG